MPERDNDDFTYSNGALETVSSGKWVKLTDASFQAVNVASNAIQASAAGDNAVVLAAWSGDTVDQYAQFVVTTAGNTGGPTLRSNPADTFYQLDVQDTDWAVYKVVGGAWTQINIIAQTTSNGDQVYFEIQGSTPATLISKRNGGTVNSFTDSAIASGAPGVYFFNVSVVLDTWNAGDFTPDDPEEPAQVYPFAVTQRVG